MNVASTREIMKAERICVIVPTYNNAGTIIDVLQRIKVYTDDIIVVNDGCTDHTKSLLKDCGLGITVVGYDKNQGKGHALKTGFETAIHQGFEYAITIDSDGQHFPEDIPLFIAAFQKDKGALIVGARNLTEDNMPRGNTFANKFSNFWFYVQTGKHLQDTQSGYRLYPLSMLNGGWFITARYEAELEFLVYTAWKNVKIVQVPVRVFYPPKDERVTHFRPYMDFARISAVNTLLCAGAIFYYLPAKILRAIRK